MAGKTAFTQKVADKICDRLADGESLRAICRDKDMPSNSTVHKWLNEQESFSKQYAHAREDQADALFDDILAIADGKDATPSSDMNERRIRIDARKWMAGKLKGKYSDKLVVDNKTEVTHKYDLDGVETGELEQIEAILAKSERSESGASEAEPSSVH